MHRQELEMGRNYYVLGMTTKAHFLRQRTEAFPVIDGDVDERIPSGTKALGVFASHKRAAEYLGDVTPDRVREFAEEIGEEIRDFSISYMNRQEVYATARSLGAEYIIVEQADGRLTLDAVLAKE